MSRRFSVVFQPDNVTVEVPAETTIIQAANKAGVFINSLCGGDGVCGRCRVVVRQGRVQGGSTEFFTRSEIQEGYVLACDTRLQSDAVIEIPCETRLTDKPVPVEGEVPLLADIGRRRSLRLAPLVTKTCVELPLPSLENNISDLQRLEQALGERFARRPGGNGTKRFQMGLKIIQRLPRLLRKANWRVTALTGHRGPLTEIIDIETGDTSQRTMCVAADIGTTTLVCHLLDLCNGNTIGQAAKYNSQASYGADVIHRIIHAGRDDDSEQALRRAVVDDLNDLIHQLVVKYRMGANDISLICAAGNTTMTHLLLGVPAENIRREPYVGGAYQLPPFRAAEIGLQVNPRGLLYCLPCISAFVGGDITAGILATGMTHGKDIRMLIDIGTNGEIAVGNEEFLVCASASAGPAFEGAECRSGMRATRGAIDHLRLSDPSHVLSFSTVGMAPAVGLCGTGYVDLVAEMLRVGVIDKTGRLDDVCPRVREGLRGEMEYMVLPAAQTGGDSDIAITQSDIRNLLRAKGAIYAAASVLLKSLNLSFMDLSEILVAGAFGNFLNLENAIAIGLLPEVPIEMLRFVGNTSLAGAKLAALCEDCYEEITHIANSATYFELSTEPTFMEQFVSACFLPHTNVELFPTAQARMSTAAAQARSRRCV